MDERMELFNSVGCAGCKNHQDSIEDGCPFEDTCTQGEMFVFDGPSEGASDGCDI